jgi:glycosyltransferase involved in cell wall biosynthesis
MAEKKYKIVTISDHPLAKSGVATQAHYIIDHLVKTGKFQVLSIAGAMKHASYAPQKFEAWKDDVVILPIDGYGDRNLIRQILDIEKPDAIWFITDPRFYTWLWEMEDEIHQVCPLLYWHVWDNLPYPKFNESYYKSTDFIGCINKLTYKFLKDAGFDNVQYIPHGVPKNDYRQLENKDIVDLRKKHFSDSFKDKFIVFYNSRNAMRKRTGNCIMAVKELIDMLPEEEKDNVFFMMHTPPLDPEGQNLFEVVNAFGLQKHVGFNDKMVDNSVMNEFYNMADVTISLSSEEGFGLSILESLMAGTPVVCTKTGGMQDQAVDQETGEEFGHCIEPDAKSLIGSQGITPYIWQDHVDPTTAANRLLDLYNKKKQLGLEYKNCVAGTKAVESVHRRFSMEQMQKAWEDAIVAEIEQFKSKTKAKQLVRMAEI